LPPCRTARGSGVRASALDASVEAETRHVEKPDLKFGFIRLTDMAPLAIAYEPQADWKVLLDRVIAGEPDRKLGEVRVGSMAVEHDASMNSACCAASA
jgi:hypothetical protein